MGGAGLGALALWLRLRLRVGNCASIHVKRKVKSATDAEYLSYIMFVYFKRLASSLPPPSLNPARVGPSQEPLRFRGEADPGEGE